MNAAITLAELPANFTSTRASYKAKALIATLGIVLFLLCYFAMLVGFVFLFRYTVLYDMGSINKFTILLKIGAVAGSGMLLLFGIKFMFKKAQKFEGKSVEITPESEPELYAFIQDLVKQTGAPRPKYIGVNNDVNAFVYYGNTFLSLFLPARKNLMIGMGLMNGLNVSEFKAVLAHEFGHFSQSSMRVGSYVYMANRIIHDMVYNRDRWDMALDQWRGLDIRLSFMAYALMPVVWLVRQFMVLFYKLLNLLYASLQREMEFHADKVAVSVSGSDAIVTALWKLEFASAAMQQAYQNVYYAAKQDIYSENMYDQQGAILESFKPRMQQLISEMKVNEQGVKKVFGEEVYSTLSMYDSHPPSSDRERNAKTPYITAEMDERHTTVLFQKAIEVQKKLTEELYIEGYGLEAEEWQSKASNVAMEQFIKEEKGDSEAFPPELLNTFNLRLTAKPDLESITTQNPFTNLDRKNILDKYKMLVNDKLEKLTEPVNNFDQELNRAQQIAQGIVKDKKFEFGGITYNRKNINNAINYIGRAKQKYLNESFGEWDNEFLNLSYAYACSGDRGEELIQNLQQFSDIQEVMRQIVDAQSALFALINEIMEMNEATENDLRNFRRKVTNRVTSAVNQSLKNLGEIEFVPLPNIAGREQLLKVTTDNMTLVTLSPECFNDGTLKQLLDQLENLVFNLNRVQMKALAQVIRVSGLKLN